MLMIYLIFFNRYCECFASRQYCDGCNCSCCNNTPKHKEIVEKAVQATLERNPKAFKNKIEVLASTSLVRFGEVKKKKFSLLHLLYLHLHYRMVELIWVNIVKDVIVEKVTA